MKKKYIVLSLVILVALSMVLIYTQLVKKVDLNFATSLTVNFSYGEQGIQITDNDLSQMIGICQGTSIKDFSVPSCGFGNVELVFKGNDKLITIYPACDNCSTMRYGNDDKWFYEISDENRAKLVDILKKYNVNLPCE